MKAREVPFSQKFITQNYRLLVRNISSCDARYLNDDLTMDVRFNNNSEKTTIITCNRACGPDNVFDFVLADEEIRYLID